MAISKNMLFYSVIYGKRQRSNSFSNLLWNKWKKNLLYYVHIIERFTYLGMRSFNRFKDF